MTAQDLPSIRNQNGISQLIVHGKPFLILGGEIGNSSAGTAAQADTILSVTFTRDPDADDQIAGIASIDQVAYVNGQWVTAQRLNGDQSDQARRLLMDSHEFRIYRVRLFTYSRH